MIITYSDMQTFQSCPRAWYLNVYRKLTPRKKAHSGALALGARVHSALEAYEDGTVDSPLVAWDALIRHDAEVLMASGFALDDLEKDNKLGRKMLEGFIEWESEEGFHDTYEVIGVEKALTMELELPELPGIKLTARGKLDRLLKRRSDGALWVNDYKTMGTFSERDRMGLIRSPQGRMYVMLLNDQLPDARVAGVVYTMLRKVMRTKTATPPFYDVMEVPITPYDLSQYHLRMVSMVEKISEVWAALDSGADHRQVAHFAPSWQCQTCPFKAPCALMQDTSMEAAEEFLGDYFETRDPYERYDATPFPDGM